MAKIRCTDCSQVLHVSDETLPDGIQSGEWFQMKCPKCEAYAYMALAEVDGQAGSR